MDVSDINPDGKYYGGFVFVPSIANHFAEHGRMTCTADASHCKGVGPQSYGKFFQVLQYDTNNQIIPLATAHHVGTESFETWDFVFRSLRTAPENFDRVGRVTIVGQEKVSMALSTIP